MCSRRDESSRDAEEAIYVALGKKFNKDSTNLLWVLENFPTARIVLLHVHWPSKWIPIMGGKFSYKLANEQEQHLHRRNERREMLELMCRYTCLCTKRKVKVEYTNDENVLRGIINLTKTFRAKRLVTASRSMSKEAELLECCQIWLVRYGNHISTSTRDYMQRIQFFQSGAIREDTETKIENEDSQELSMPALEPLTNEFEGYTTALSDQEDEILSYQDEIRTLTDTSSCHLDLTDQTESTVCENKSPTVNNTTTDGSGGEMFSEEASDHSVKHKSFRNDAAEDQLIWAQVKQLKREVKKLKTYLKKESSAASKGKAVFSEQKLKGTGDNPNPPIPEHVTEFSQSVLKRATNNFNPKNVIGEGGYGPVYRGKLRGALVAIKMLNSGSKQGRPEFQQELLTGLLELNIAEQVQEGLRMGVARQILDASAGDWPEVQAEQLLRLALRCCSLERKQRPSLESKEWRTLDILRAMAGKSRS